MKTDTSTVPARPMVGVSLLVIREIDGRDHVLLAKRKGSHGAGQYGTPGGHLEIGESYEACAVRELREECGDGLKVTRPVPMCVTNLRDYLPKHYADIGMIATWISGEPELMEPEKAEGWSWYPVDALPVPWFGALSNLFIARETGRTFFG